MTVFPRAGLFIYFPSFARRRRRKRSTRISSPPSRTQTAQTQTAMGLSRPARGPSIQGSPASLRRRRRKRSIRRSPGTEGRAGGGTGVVSPCRAPRGAHSTESARAPCSRDKEFPSPESNARRVVLQVLTLRQVVLCYLRRGVTFSLTSRLSCQNWLITPLRRHLSHPVASCFAGEAASPRWPPWPARPAAPSLHDISPRPVACKSWSGTAALSLPVPAPRSGTGVAVDEPRDGAASSQPVAAQSLAFGPQTLPPASLVLSANLGSGRVRSKWGSGDILSKH